MLSSIRQKAVVDQYGKIEIQSAELPIGATVDVIVLIEPDESDTTDYLLSTESNRRHLLEAVKDLDKHASYTYINPDVL